MKSFGSGSGEMPPRRFLDNDTFGAALPYSAGSEDRRRNSSSGKKNFEKFKLQVGLNFYSI